MKRLQKLIIILIICIACCFYVSSSWFQFMLIQGNSMLPAYHSWQLVILEKKYQQLCVGDVIAFNCDSLSSVLVKRVMAVPGDTVQISDGILFVNGIASTGNEIVYSGIASVPIQLAEDEYFVLGDNYEESKDSRYKEVGCIEKNTIIGKVFPCN